MFPRRENHVTVLYVRGGKVERIGYADTAKKLAAIIPLYPGDQDPHVAVHGPLLRRALYGPICNLYFAVLCCYRLAHGAVGF